MVSGAERHLGHDHYVIETCRILRMKRSPDPTTFRYVDRLEIRLPNRIPILTGQLLDPVVPLCIVQKTVDLVPVLSFRLFRNVGFQQPILFGKTVEREIPQIGDQNLPILIVGHFNGIFLIFHPRYSIL